MISGLTRDAQHVYRFNGKVIPGVTRIMDGTLRSFAGINREVLEKKRELGTLVDHATALDANDDLDESSVDKDVEPYLMAFRKFRFEVKPVFLSTHELVYHPTYGYAGEIDHRVSIQGVEGVLDKKTSVEDGADAVQISAYLAAKYSQDEKTRVRCARWILQLSPNGTYRFRPYKDYFHVFLAALTCYRFKQLETI